MAVSSKFRRRLVLGLGLLLFACTEGPRSGDSLSETQPRAKDLFTTHCSSCHGATGDLGVSGAKNLQKSKLNLQEIKQIIREGKNECLPSRGLLKRRTSSIPLPNTLKRYSTKWHMQRLKKSKKNVFWFL